MGGLFVVARRLNLDTRQLNGWIIYSLVFSFLPGLNVDWRGHLGGLITGAAVTWGLVHAPRKHRNWIQAGAVLAGLVVAVARHRDPDGDVPRLDLSCPHWGQPLWRTTAV